MSVLAINDRFVRSAIVTADSWNQFFDDIATGLNASVTGLEAANITNLSIGGDKIADGAVTTAKIANNAIDGQTEIDGQQITARHFDFDGVATTVHELNTSIDWGTAGIKCMYQINQPNKGTQMMIYTYGTTFKNCPSVGQYSGTINFNTLSYFGDPNFGAPAVYSLSPYITFSNIIGSTVPCGLCITNITGFTSMDYQFEVALGSGTVFLNWSLFARRDI